MTNNVIELSNHLQVLLQQLSTAERAKLSRKIAHDLRKSQSKRIAMQKNPDGSSYTPRKKQIRDKRGAIKGKMFQKIKNNKYFKTLSTQNKISIGFVNRTAAIARIHQYGLKSRTASGNNITYSRRELLGLTNQDIQLIEDSFLKHINL